jgi:hypothetical protein
MIKYLLPAIFSTLIYPLAQGQVIYGTSNYIEYHTGNLPVVISVPHGGYLTPASIPDRTCNNPVFAMDAFTLELGATIDSAFFEATGCRPHVIYCNLRRSKLDANRNLASGACGHPEAVTAWQEFHDFIGTAQQSASAQYGGKIFFLDLHGHGNPIQRIELGYLLYDDELELPDATLNNSTYVGYSSIQNLVATNVNNLNHVELLRGPWALGTLLGNHGYPSVPSEQIPVPGTTTNYFSGGYITANHTSYALNNDVDGVQVECNYNGIRDTWTNRRAFADSLVQVMLNFMNYHYGVDMAACGSLSADEDRSKGAFSLFPNPASTTVRLHLPESVLTHASLYDLQGRKVLDAALQTGDQVIDIRYLPKGLYVLMAKEMNGAVYVKKLVVE